MAISIATFFRKPSSFLIVLLLAHSPVGLADAADENEGQLTTIQDQSSCAEILTGRSPEIEQDMRQAVLRYGRAAFSFDVVESPADYHWFHFDGKHGSGGIAYKEVYRTRVIIGDPLLSQEDWADGLTAFLQAPGSSKATIATFASEEFSKVALETQGAAVEAQTEVSFNPQTWELKEQKRQLRKVIRKLGEQGLLIVTMKNKKEPEPWFRAAAEKLIADWRQNSLKRPGSVHGVNLWDASEYKQYFALMDPETKEFQALVVSRPLVAKQGFSLWSARASKCPNGSLEYTIIEGAIRSMRNDGVTYLTFGPFSEARPYIFQFGGTGLSRFIMKNLPPIYLKYSGHDQTMNYFKKFGFEQSDKIYDLIWPRTAWMRPYAALYKLFKAKPK